MARIRNRLLNRGKESIASSSRLLFYFKPTRRSTPNLSIVSTSQPLVPLGRIVFNSFPAENCRRLLFLSPSSKTLCSSEAESEKFPLVYPSIQQPLFLKAYTLREPSDVPKIKAEIIGGNILIVKITPIAKRSEQETKSAINELVDFVDSIQGDIARLEEERIVLTPPIAKIWRDKTSNSTIPGIQIGEWFGRELLPPTK